MPDTGGTYHWKTITEGDNDMSLAAATLTFREGIEAALIIAIMLGYLRKMGRMNRQWSVWAGALTAGLLAVAFTVLLQIVGAQFESPAKEVYEGATSLFAVAVLTYMIFWMSKQARNMKGSLEHGMKEGMAQGATWGLFGVAFLTVAREGIETALFLSASAFESSGMDTLVGGIVGLIAALGVAWTVYGLGVRLQLRTFFKITSVLLVIFAASILRYAIHEFEEVGCLPPLIDPIWNTSSWLPTSSSTGAILQTFFGYTAQPSLLQVIGYVSYLLVTGLLLLKPRSKPATATIINTPAIQANPLDAAPSEAEIVGSAPNGLC
jgi:high-affinity iron transporter